MPTHYEILKVPEGASVDVIRAAYRRRLIEVHPDKSTSGQEGLTVQDVQTAWEVLRHAEARRTYDDVLAVRTGDSITPWESVYLVDMQKVLSSSGASMFMFDCRCGETFELTDAESKDLGTASLLLQCSGCGNVLEVKCAAQSRGCA
jgi:curved DNA-binding protein CbpA